jgi:hypothetical protein
MVDDGLTSLQILRGKTYHAVKGLGYFTNLLLNTHKAT